MTAWSTRAFIDWLKTQLANGKHEPKRICFQITESIAEQYMNAAVAQLGALKKLGFRIALERFGSGRDPYKLLSAMPLDFIKVDGALVQDLAANPETQIIVKKLVEQAVKLKIETIAERVEDANTMAVLWQLGVQFIQGYFVNAPEEVVMSEGQGAVVRSGPAENASHPDLLAALLLASAAIAAGRRARSRRRTERHLWHVFGRALLLDVYRPAKPNGHGVVFVAGSGLQADARIWRRAASRKPRSNCGDRR